MNLDLPSLIKKESVIKCSDTTFYIDNCEMYHMPVDGNILSTIELQFPILYLNKFASGELLPLKEILEKNTSIKKVIVPYD